MQKQPRSRDVQQAIDETQQCHAICIETIQHCLRMGGAHTEAQHLAILLDCAETCHLTEDSMLRDSSLAAMLSATCADACNVCARECERFPGDAQMMACADRCRSCAQACRAMASARP